MKKINKYKLGICALLSFLFSALILIDTKLINNDEMFTVHSQLHFAGFSIDDLFRLILFMIINFVIGLVIIKIYEYINSKIEWKEKKISKIFWLTFIVLLVCWLPYVLSYFPGGVYIDTYISLEQLQSFSLNGFNNLTNHTVFYTFFLKFCNIITQDNPFTDLTKTFIIVQLVQYLVCAFSISYCINILNKKKMPKTLLYLIIAFFALFPLVPLYVISIWKDTPFNFILLMFVIKVFDIITSQSSFLENKKEIIIYCILSLLVCFLRNNGIYIAFGTTLALYLYFHKSLLKKKKGFFISSLLVILCSFIIQGPFYNLIGLNKNSGAESFAIPFQQLAYTIKNDGNISKKDLDFMNAIMPIEDIKESYRPLNFDALKWNKNFNTEFLEKNKVKFLKVWLKELPKNLKQYIAAYFLQTMGYWDILKDDSTLFNYQLTEWKMPPYEERINQKDLFYDITHISFRDIISKIPNINNAVFVWITIISFFITLIFKKRKYLIIYIPAMLSLLTIMLATPVAFSLRYIYILVLMIPFNIIIPLLPYKEERK